jgi:putative addiction module component (TIGR02574 family)
MGGYFEVMTETAEGLKSQLALLPRPDRAELAHFLINSLDEGMDPDAESAWDCELDQRMQDINTGTAGGASAEEVVAELREKYSCSG